MGVRAQPTCEYLKHSKQRSVPLEAYLLAAHTGLNVLAAARRVLRDSSYWFPEMERIPALRNLPRELFDIISEYSLEGTITREEAKADRKKLMKERRNFVMQHNEDVFEVKFSLCEH